MADIPPGLEGNLKHHVSGGEEGSQWKEFTTTRHYTNAFVVQGSKVLLGMKKRGWGMGKYNGFGGKVDAGETPLEAAKRELEEEAGIQAPLVFAGTLLFLTDGVDWAFHIDIYRADSYTGTITESEEMKPEWFSTSSDPAGGLAPIPYEKMWETDDAWLPLLLSGKIFVGRADFIGEKDQSRPYKWWSLKARQTVFSTPGQRMPCPTVISKGHVEELLPRSVIMVSFQGAIARAALFWIFSFFPKY